MGERREYNPLPLFGNPILLLLNVRSRRIFPLALPSSFYKLLEYRRGNYIVTRVKRYFCFMAKEREREIPSRGEQVGIPQETRKLELCRN